MPSERTETAVSTTRNTLRLESLYFFEKSFIHVDLTGGLSPCERAIAEQEVPAVLHAAVAEHAAVVVFVAGVGGVKPVVAVVIAFSS